jgi:hypothetical protein
VKVREEGREEEGREEGGRRKGGRRKGERYLSNLKDLPCLPVLKVAMEDT